LVTAILPKSFNLHNTHQKSNRQTLFLYSEKKNNRSEISLDTGFRNGVEVLLFDGRIKMSIAT